ncbi:PREDICTED: uncharacterized protein LOC106818329 isoform X2 [Priapulus caudatus]|uniref:Uncharacterized protein LOC106818329 isoform X2 n=1 Tax=Priapulus caudatus TaxID=37621 RepID=A0ABM1F261_PRICU|nr:PREDICTED: uncharacterized protein LOC106818329 isoform X2 [Priapulus caudatus]
MWVTMEKKGVLPGRTWQSLRCRYLKIIAVNQDNMFAPKDSSSTWLKKRVKLVDAVDQINTGNKANTRVRHSDSGRTESKDSSGKVKLSMVPSTTAARLDQTESRHSINGDVCEPSTSTQVDPVRAESSSKNERKRGARGKPLSVSSGYSYSEDDDAALALSPTKCQGRSDVGGNNIHEASESSTDSEDVAGEVEQAGPTVWQGATMPAAASLEETVSVARSLMEIYQISLEDLDAEIIKHQGDVNAVMDSLDLRESNSTDESLQY